MKKAWNIFRNIIFAESHSLRRQMLQPVILASLIFAGILGALQYQYEQERAKAKIHEEVATLVKFLQLTSAPYLVNWDVTALEGFAEQAKSNSYIRQIVFMALDDRVLTKSAASEVSDSDVRFTEDIKDSKGEKVGSMRVIYSEDAVKAIVRQTIGIGLGGYFLMLCFVIATIWLLSRRVSVPFSKVGQLLLELSAISETNSQRLNDSAANLSATAGQQSSAVQETVSSISEMQAMMEQTIQNVKHVNELGTQISQKSESGTHTMSEMGRAMSDIRDTAGDLNHMVEIIHGMSEKTKVIHDIVFKTQLLAFNASIEAARAGQHGKGFAVVADEVRDLSDLAGSAANDIETMIRESRKNAEKVVNIVTDRIEQGEEISRKALTSFEEIAVDIKNISGSINEVFTATQEQTTGIMQTVRAMDQLNDAAQHNAVAADVIVGLGNEGRISSHLLKESSDQLMGLVQGKGFTKTRVTPPPPPRAPTEAVATAMLSKKFAEQNVLDLSKKVTLKAADLNELFPEEKTEEPKKKLG